MPDQNDDQAVTPDAANTAGGTQDASQPDPFVVLENLNAENATLKDRALRLMADMENMRRRTEKEVTDAKIYGVSNFAREMLNVVDNLRRAVSSVPAEAVGAAGPLKTLLEGVELTEKDFLSRLARFGIKPLDPQGKKFDPNMHEALFEMPDESVPSGTVVQVMETGYAIGDRVLRPAKVGVSRGGPKVAAETLN
ncbi:nucleotide exchange factor GrpE [Lichenifustis flavocetrariae]|uniref:Protein GrpE n=1 Tax=Lichenifustis flavocetrariae TaxID=2949735 RepID=A0AA42CML9_9HYPH|nr:nucleotide exchange factor GrpE [Lichenifustis flavocetrariae]MCW6508495.1 nucleotide exchange factor GrpE [Lichenifustis flavocetrariae]